MARARETMIMTALPRLFSRHWKLQAGLATLLVALIPPLPAQTHTRAFPEANLTRGITAGGHPYLSGGISFDEQCAIERESHLYNLKIVFSRPAGTLMAPTFLMIGFNNARHVEKIWPRAPWFYIRLPTGSYTLMARLKHDVVLVRDVYLAEGQRRTYVLRGN